MATLACATAYQFRDIERPEAWLAGIRARCAREGLLGTVTLAPEGINLGVSGPPGGLAGLARHLAERTPFDRLALRASPAATAPYRRLHVRAQDALLSVRVGLPVAQRAPARRLSPERLRRWLDQGRPLRLLDVRNRFESRLGKFARAETLELAHFRDFPARAEALRAGGVPTVLYCTGGIRCEVASAWLARRQAADLWQLEGGILNYFAQCGGAHWAGECFVFDDRLAVDAQLRPTYPRLCRRCQRPLPDAGAGVCPDCAAQDGGAD